MKTKDRILATLLKQPGMSRSELQAELDVCYMLVSREVKALVGEGMLREERRVYPPEVKRPGPRAKSLYAEPKAYATSEVERVTKKLAELFSPLAEEAAQ